jgi:hypothetical protein
MLSRIENNLGSQRLIYTLSYGNTVTCKLTHFNTTEKCLGNIQNAAENK